MTSENLNNIEKILKEPVFLGHDTNAKIVRAQLFFVSTISLAYILMGLKISNESSILGIRFSNLNEGHVQAVLLILVIYLLTHFVWLSWDSFMEWKLRITGTKSAFITSSKFAAEDADYPDDPRQSTLYNFYSESLKDPLFDLKKAIEGYTRNIEHTERLAIIESINQLQKLIESDRVTVSLKRFDNWFKYFLRSQNLRWIFIEFSLPVFLALTAIIMLFFKH